MSAAPATPTAAELRAALESVVDPELHASIVELGMVGEIRVSADGVATVPIALTTTGCPLRGQISHDVEARLGSFPGISAVRVEYGEMNREQKARAMDRARQYAQEHANRTEVAANTRVLVVASGKGGVGKSSVTANLAVALAQRGLAVGVLDADIWGFSLPRMLGVEGRLGGENGKITPNRVEVPAGVGGPGGVIHVVSMGFLVDDEQSALMWRGLVLNRAVEQFLTDVRWGTLDYLLVDMPPGTGDIQMGLARLLPQAEMLVVTTPARVAQKVAARVADMARRSSMRVVGVVENMSAFTTPDGARHAIFGDGGGEELAREFGVPLVARVPIDPDVSTGGDDGVPIVLSHPSSAAATAFRDLATNVATELLPPLDLASCTARMLDLVSRLA